MSSRIFQKKIEENFRSGNSTDARRETPCWSGDEKLEDETGVMKGYLTLPSLRLILIDPSRKNSTGVGLEFVGSPKPSTLLLQRRRLDKEVRSNSLPEVLNASKDMASNMSSTLTSKYTNIGRSRVTSLSSVNPIVEDKTRRNSRVLVDNHKPVKAKSEAKCELLPKRSSQGDWIQIRPPRIYAVHSQAESSGQFCKWETNRDVVLSKMSPIERAHILLPSLRPQPQNMELEEKKYADHA